METHVDLFLKASARLTWEDCWKRYPLTSDQKKNIQSVRIQSGNGLIRRGGFGIRQQIAVSDNEMIKVFRSLSREFPALGRLRIRFRGTDLPVEALIAALQTNINLTILRIFDVKLKVTHSRDTFELSKAIREHPALKKVYLDLCQVHERSRASLHTVVAAFSQNPFIEDISLSNSKISPESSTATSSWILETCRSRSLKSLKLEMVEEMKNEHLVALARSLCLEGADAVPALTSLSIETSNAEESACIAVAEMIRKNRTLVRMELVLYRRNTAEDEEDETPAANEIDWDKTGIADALTYNSSLKYVRIFAENIMENEYPEAFKKMVQVNCTLEHLVLGWDGETSARIEFYLMLNRHGRVHLTDLAPDTTWIDFIIQHSDDLRVLFYVLSRNPLLALEIIPH